jgi:hypothetical protein
LGVAEGLGVDVAGAAVGFDEGPAAFSADLGDDGAGREEVVGAAGLGGTEFVESGFGVGDDEAGLPVLGALDFFRFGERFCGIGAEFADGGEGDAEERGFRGIRGWFRGSCRDCCGTFPWGEPGDP